MKRWFTILGISCLVVFGIMVSLPSILSTNAIGKPIVTFALKQCAPLQECTYDALSLGWWSSFRLIGFKATLSTPDHSEVSIKECQIDKSLLNLLVHSNDLGTITIVEPRLKHTLQQIFGGVHPWNANSGKINNDKIKKNRKLPYLTELVPDSALKGHLFITNGTIEIQDGKSQLLFLANTSHSEVKGAFDQTGPLAIVSDTIFWDALEGSLGSFQASCQVKKDMSLDGDVDLQIPSISLRTIQALTESFGISTSEYPKLTEFLDTKASVSVSLKENIGSFHAKIGGLEVSTKCALHGSQIEIQPGILAKATLTPELYTKILSFYEIASPYRLLKPLQISVSAPHACTFDWKTTYTSDLVLNLVSQDTLWTNGTTPFYSSLELETKYAQDGIQNHLLASIKKDLQSQEKTSFILDFSIPKVFSNPLPFSIHTEMEGGFIASLMPEPYVRFIKTFMQPRFTCGATAQGTISEVNGLDIEGEFTMNSSFGKKQAQFKMNQQAIKITHAIAELDLNPHDLSSQVTGETCRLLAQADEIYIPLKSSFSQLLNELTMSLKVSMSIPSLTYNDQKIVDAFSLEALVQKKPDDATVSLEMEQRATVTSTASLPRILAFIPEKSAIHTLFNSKSGELTSSWNLNSSAASFTSSISGIVDYVAMKFQAKEPWICSLNIKQKDLLLQYLPCSFQSCSLSVSPFKASVSQGKLTFNQDPEMIVTLLDVSDGSSPSINCTSTIKYSTPKKEWNGYVQAIDANDNQLLSATLNMNQSFAADIRADILPSILPFLKTYKLSTFQPFYDGLKTAHFDLTLHDARYPLSNSKMNIAFLSERVELVAQGSVQNNVFQFSNVNKKPLLNLKVDSVLSDFLKKREYMAKSVQLVTPTTISVPNCSLKSRFDMEKKSVISLDGDCAIHTDELRLKLDDKKCTINPVDVSLHIEDAKRAVCTIKSNSGIGFETKMSISGDCTATYKEPLQALTLDKIHVQGSLLLKDIPATIIQAFVPKAEIASEFLSPVFTICTNFTSDKLNSGEAQFHINSQNLSCDLDSSRIQKGSLTFTSPLKATLKLSKKGSPTLFKKLSSYICSDIENDHEIHLEIAPQGTSIPLSNFSTNAVTLPSIVLDIGKMEVKSSGVLKNLIHILHPKASKTVDFWCTKSHSSLRQGIFTLQRVDCMAANLIHIFVWGSIDIPKKEIDMKLAIPPDTFDNMHLYLSLPRPVTMAIRGNIDSPSIDMTRLTARLAGAGASTCGAAAGPLFLLGSALQIASTVGEDEADIPPPSETPFPWEKEKKVSSK